ncbi:MAG: tetratricopeptide repeat protein [Gammaproteobacteria bacterium]|nr:tetratricopeptide repeat protein [Gammaproteobacteria bacterium]
MEELLTDQQQAEKVKGWVRANGIFLVAGVALGLGGLFGWNQWRNYQERQAEEASAIFETFLQSVRASQLEQAEAGMAALATEYGSSPYAPQGRLVMARLYLDQGKPELAAEALRTVVENGWSPEIRNIARLRLARVLIFQEKYDEALKTLGDPGSKAFAPAFHDVRGDAYYAMGKHSEARSEYEQVLNGDIAAQVIERTFVQAKLDDLGGSTAILATPPAALPAP